MLQELINQYNGQNGIGDTPQNDGQCVGLVEVWLDKIGAPHIWGNACDLAANADTNSYVITPNDPSYVPTEGDIAVLPAGWGGSSVGHTFIVAPGTDATTLVAFEQNDRIGGGDGSCRIFDGIGWPEGLTFIHPKVLDPAPAPAPAPELVAPVVVPVVAPVTPVTPVPTPVTPVLEPVTMPLETPPTTKLQKLENNAHYLVGLVAYATTIYGAARGFLSATDVTALLSVITASVSAVIHGKNRKFW
jgi:hypothetical protein